MRRFVASSLFAILLTGQIAQAGECARQAERPAFEDTELKSELMVTAISCKENSRYNSFMNRFGSSFVGDEKLLNAYFNRNFGRQGQKQHDEFVTSLANAQSQQGLKQGSAFCDERTPMFDEVMALRTGDDLSPYAEGKNLVSPTSLMICSAEPVEKGHRRGRRSGGSHRASSGHHGKSKHS
jgi:hypothetical protein